MLRTAIITIFCFLLLIFYLLLFSIFYCRKLYTVFFLFFLYCLTHKCTEVRLALYFCIFLACEKRQFYSLIDLQNCFVLLQKSKSLSVQSSDVSFSQTNKYTAYNINNLSTAVQLSDTLCCFLQSVLSSNLIGNYLLYSRQIKVQ